MNRLKSTLHRIPKNKQKSNRIPRLVSDSLKKAIAGRQFYQCANKPHINLCGLEGYSCPLWRALDLFRGNFDESGYDIDHIIPLASGGSNSEDNLQALCKSCHGVKTKRFNRE